MTVWAAVSNDGSRSLGPLAIISGIESTPAGGTPSISTTRSRPTSLRMASTFASCISVEQKTSFCSGVLQHITALVSREGCVDRDDRPANEQCGEVGNRPLGPVLAQNGHTVTVLNSPVLEALGGSHRALVKLAGGNRLPPVRVSRRA